MYYLCLPLMQDAFQCQLNEMPPPPPEQPAAVAGARPAPARLVLASPLAAGVEANLRSLFRGEADLITAVTGFVQVQRLPVFERLLAHEAIDSLALQNLLASWEKKADTVTKYAPGAVFLVFADEANTVDAPGGVCEVFGTHCWMGRSLKPALFFVGAVNPHGRAAVVAEAQPKTKAAVATASTIRALPAPIPPTQRATVVGASAARHSTRRALAAATVRGDGGRTSSTLRSGGVTNFNHLAAVAPAASWTQGSRARSGAGTSDVEEQGDYLPQTPFLVRQLSASMMARTVTQARQNADVERDFISEFSEMRPDGALPGEFIETVLCAQQLVRGYDLPRVHISIRDPVKCLRTYDYLSHVSLPTALDLRTNDLSGHTNPYIPEHTAARHVQGAALLAAIGAVYYSRLPSLAHVMDSRMAFDARADFEAEMRPFIETLEAMGYVAQGTAARGLRRIVADGHKHLWKHARDIPPFVTPTAGLQEAFWNFVLSVHTRVPLLVTGPPGW